MQIKNAKIIYEQSEAMYFQGNRRKLKKEMSYGYGLFGGSNGSYIIGKSANVYIKNDGEIIDMKDAILEFYGKKRISQKQVDGIQQKLDNEEVYIKYNKKTGDVKIKYV
jgi:hypothetical protein